MLLEETCFLVPSAWDFHVLSPMLKTVSIKILHTVFVYIFYIPKVLLKEVLMFF